MSERVQGLKELREQLKQLGAIAGQKIMASAARAAMKPVLEEARRLAPVSSGALRDSIKLKAVKPRSGSIVASAGLIVARGTIEQEIPVEIEGEVVDVDVAEAKGAGSRWHFAEFGTARQAAHPFLRPAMIGKRAEVIELFKGFLRKKIDAAKRRQLGSVVAE